MPRTVSPRQQAYGRATAAAQMNCRVEISRPGEPTFNETTGIFTPALQVIYSGAGRIWALDSAGTITAGDGSWTQESTYCSIAWDSLPVPRRDDILTVVSCPGDPSLNGHAFQVQDVDGGGQLRVSRRMRVTRMGPSARRD